MSGRQQEYDAQLSLEWMRQHRFLFMLLIITYTIFVTKAPRIWKRRRMPGVATIIFYWNAFNATADISLFISLLPDFLASFYGGFYSSLCLNDGLYKNSRTGKALLTFHISKVWELLDTVFVILDGRETSVLHVAHHVVTCVSIIYSYQYIGAVARWISVTNLAAHSALYTYLAAQSFTWKRRSRSACVVSGIQLAQFPICLVGLFKIRNFLNDGKKCETGYNGLSIIIYAIFFLLFIQFYINKYTKNNRSNGSFSTDSKYSIHQPMEEDSREHYDKKYVC